MDNRGLLENLIKDFRGERLNEFFRKANGAYRPQLENYNHYLETETKVGSISRLGTLEFTDGRKMIMLVGQSKAELTSQSGKQRQYEIARKVLKDKDFDAGIFVFHDNTGRFRFSLITAQYTGTKREFSSFRRYTYFVSPETSARTFVEQIGMADFSSVEKITDAFSVEPGNKEFFTKFREIFEEAEGTIKLKWADEK